MTVPGDLPRAAKLPAPRLPGQHFAAAFVCLVLGAAGLVWAAPDLAAGAYLNPRVIGVAHLFTLGWIAMSIMGVLYQFLPVGLGTPIRNERLGHLAFGLFLPGVLLFAGGTAFWLPPLTRAGVGLVTAGALVFATNLALTLRGVPQRGVTWWGLAIGTSNLVATLLLGVLLSINLEVGWLGASRVGAAAAHAHLAVLGFVMPVVVGVAHRLLPMFLAAPGVDRRPAVAALVLLGLGAPILAVGLGFGVTPLARAGAPLALAGLLAFVLHAGLYFRSRRIPALDAGMRLAASGILGLAGAAALAPVVLVTGARAPGLVTAYGLLALLGLSLFVTGHYYRIIPHLVWRHRYLPHLGARPIPKVNDLVAPRPAAAAHVLLTAGGATLASGPLGAPAGPWVSCAGALLFTAGAVVVAAQMAKLARTGA